MGFVVPARKGGLIAGVGKCLVHVDWETKKVTKLHEVEEGLATRFNDGKCDPQGRVWAGMGVMRFRLVSSKQNKRPMGHIVHLRNQFIKT